ncbi:TAF RNA polymerase IA-like domain-containing protein [Pandoravirus kuranda]|uniref:TAF RNA polymerase IA-like domain-containing protein n=1 Tax=Pandoravirus kuranda TaxID=3019033 RepID=A0AA95EDX8_9VIRU|nr:TAF RNA polymerase IA-like domain-containing protein [Pandoravirus kuranda]
MHGGGVLVFRFRYRHQKQWREARCSKGPRWESVRYWLEKRAGLLRASSSKGACASYIEGRREVAHGQCRDAERHREDEPLADDDEIRAHDMLVLAVRPIVWRAHVHQPFVPTAYRRKHHEIATRGRRRDAIDRARSNNSNNNSNSNNNNDSGDGDGGTGSQGALLSARDDARWMLMDERARIEAIAMGDSVVGASRERPDARCARDTDDHETRLQRRDDPPDVHPSNLDANARGHPPLKSWVDHADVERQQIEQRRAQRRARLLATPDPFGPLDADHLCMSCGAVGHHRTRRCPRACEPGYRPLSERRMPAGQPRDAFRPALEWERDQALVRFPNRADPSGRFLFFMRRSVPPAPRPRDWPLVRLAPQRPCAPP